MRHPVIVSSLDENHQKLLANTLFSELKAHRWRRHRKIANHSGLARGDVSFRALGHHGTVDSDQVARRLTEACVEERYVWALAEPDERFDFPPHVLMMYLTPYRVALLDYEEVKRLAWIELLYSSIEVPFTVRQNRHGSWRIKANVETLGMTEAAGEVAVSLLYYTNVIELGFAEYDEWKGEAAEGMIASQVFAVAERSGVIV